MYKFIDLLEILEERQWEYVIDKEGKVNFVLGNREIEFSKYDEKEVKEIIEELNRW